MLPPSLTTTIFSRKLRIYPIASTRPLAFLIASSINTSFIYIYRLIYQYAVSIAALCNFIKTAKGSFYSNAQSSQELIYRLKLHQLNANLTAFLCCSNDFLTGY